MLCLVSTYTRTIYVIMLRNRWEKTHTQIKLVSHEWTAQVWIFRFSRVSGIGTGQLQFKDKAECDTSTKRQCPVTDFNKVCNKEEKREQRAVWKNPEYKSNQRVDLRVRWAVDKWVEMRFPTIYYWMCIKNLLGTLSFFPLEINSQIMKYRKTSTLFSIYLFLYTDKYLQYGVFD